MDRFQSQFLSDLVPSLSPKSAPLLSDFCFVAVAPNGEVMTVK